MVRSDTSQTVITDESICNTLTIGEALQIAVKRREAKSKGEKERYKHLNTDFQRIARRERKSSSVINARK